MKVAVVGCSGTGSIVIELLARNCVGELVLVDDDRVEEGNLNRIVNSRARHVVAGAYKVEAVAEEVREFGLGTKVRTFVSTISDAEAARAVAGCDVVFGCVDSVEGRHVLSMLTSAYAIPDFDMGVEIVPDGVGGIENAVADAHYIQPGGSSLMSRGVFIPRTSSPPRRCDGPTRVLPPSTDRRVSGRGARGPTRRDAAEHDGGERRRRGLPGAAARFPPRPQRRLRTQRWGVTHGYWEHGPDGAPCRFMGQRGRPCRQAGRLMLSGIFRRLRSSWVAG